MDKSGFRNPVDQIKQTTKPFLKPEDRHTASGFAFLRGGYSSFQRACRNTARGDSDSFSYQMVRRDPSSS